MKIIAATSFFLISFISISMGAWQYPGCPEVTDNDFREVNLITKVDDPLLQEPIEMAFDPVYDNQGTMHVNFYFVERRGRIKFYDAQNDAVSVIGTLDVCASCPGAEQEGLVGIALDPGFKDNHWIYLFYSPVDPAEYRVSRFTLENNQMDMGSEKMLLNIPAARGTGIFHTGGAMAFDAYGDLWMVIGNNSADDPHNIDEDDKFRSAEWSSSNTGNLRGGILRIHPDDNAPGGYTIPEGNIGDYFARLADEAGDVDRAAELRDTEKVLPEIYAKGVRGIYTLTLDPVRRWAAIGDPGPNRGEETDEVHVLTHPAFLGWPYYVGDNLEYSGDNSPEAPRNTSRWNEGLTVLPPAEVSLYNYTQRCAMTGPIYRYDGGLQSDIKFPPHFDRAWFIMDFNAPSWVRVLKLNEDVTAVADNQEIFTNIDFHNIIEMEAGPDGALYLINYDGYLNSGINARISRMEYTGDCSPEAPVPEYAGCLDTLYEEYDPGASGHDSTACLTERVGAINRMNNVPGVRITSSVISITSPGAHAVELRAVHGKKLFAAAGEDARDYRFDRMGMTVDSGGIYIIKVFTNQGVVNRKVILF
jgi:cytochrome c